MAHQDMKFDGDYLEREFHTISAKLDAGATIEDLSPVKVYRHRSVARAMAARLAGRANASILEIGVGGSLVVHEASKLGLACHAVDANPNMVAYTRRLGQAYGSNVTVEEADAFKLPYADGQFDLVFSVGMLEHYSPEDQLLLVREHARVSRGWVEIDVPNEGPDSSIHFLIKDHEDTHLDTDFVKLATDAGLVDLELGGRGMFCPQFGTEQNSPAYQAFVRERFPELWKDMSAVDIDPLVQAESETTHEERMRYGSIHYFIGRVA
ncbi:hypothetical protein BH11MYX1_BH11MYX1_08020 [soil metagenome]